MLIRPRQRHRTLQQPDGFFQLAVLTQNAAQIGQRGQGVWRNGQHRPIACHRLIQLPGAMGGKGLPFR